MRFTFCSPSRAATKSYVESYSARFAEDGFAPWTIIHAAENRIIGWGGLNRDPKEPDWGIEVAYFLDPAYWGRGLATELVWESLNLAFYDLGLSQVGAFARPDNHASVRVLAKCGFVRVGFVPQLERDQFAISAASWRTLNPLPQPTQAAQPNGRREPAGATRGADRRR
jgi:RimJ/RimL family protein N-acetyltransferase